MGQLKITGASDDLIEIEGDVHDEISVYRCGEKEPEYLAISDGTLLKVKYGDGNSGVWRFQLVARGQAICVITQAPENDDDNYTDTVELTLEGRPFTWVLHGKKMAA